MRHAPVDKLARLAPEDADLVRRDGDLPGLTTLLDPQSFLEAMNGALPEAGIAAAEPLYARYKPQMNLLLQYALQTQSGEESLVYAKAYGPDAPPHLEKARNKPGITGSLGTKCFVIEDLKMVVSPFPNDSRLKQLHHLEDKGGVKKMLRGLGIAAKNPAPLETLRYKPERRYVARYAGGDGAVVKFYAPGDYERAESNASAFEEGFKRTGPLRLARILSGSEEYAAISTEWAEGRNLEEVLRSPSDGEEVARLAGAALAELHAQDVRGLKYTTRQEEVNDLSVLGSGLAFTLPDLAVETYALVGRLAPEMLAAPLEPVPVHGDFYDEQAIVAGDHITILDLDRATFGDPASDLGNFAAHLERDALSGELTREDVRRLEQALLDGYDPRGNSEVRGRFALYKAAGLLKLAPEPFRRRRAGWPDETRGIIHRSREILDAG